MAITIKAYPIKRNSNYLGGQLPLNGQSFNRSQMVNVRVAYLPPATSYYNYDLTTPQLDGGVIPLASPSIPAGASLGIDFSYNDGSDSRFTRYFCSCNSADVPTMENDADY